MNELTASDATLESPFALLFIVNWAGDWIEEVPARFDIVLVTPSFVMVFYYSLVVVFEDIGLLLLLVAEGVRGAE